MYKRLQKVLEQLELPERNNLRGESVISKPDNMALGMITRLDLDCNDQAHKSLPSLQSIDTTVGMQGNKKPAIRWFFTAGYFSQIHA